MSGRAELPEEYWVDVDDFQREFFNAPDPDADEQGAVYILVNSRDLIDINGVADVRTLRRKSGGQPFESTSTPPVQYRFKSEDDTVVQRLGNATECMAEFNRQVVLLRPMYQQISQEARMLDKSAAMLIAGAACLSVRGNVWVDCNMESEWFDSSDEKNLMKFAWNDVIGKDNTATQDSLDRMSAGGRSELAGSADPRLAHITTVLRSFRKAQLTMQLYSLSPGAEAALSGLVIDALEIFPQLAVFGDAAESKVYPRSTVSEHDDRVRRMARVLRRIPSTRNEFCRVAGNTLRYNISLQEGCAISTRRLNQIQSDMRTAIGVWVQFLENNMDRIVHDLKLVWDDTENFYVFDWTTHRLKILDSEQYSIVAPAFGGSIEEEVMYQETCGTRICQFPENTNEEADTNAVLAGQLPHGWGNRIPRTKTKTVHVPRASPYRF
jgi:hypothetical protein